MRVYEFAKKHDLSSKEIIDYLASEGVLVKSHMSVIPEDGVSLLQKKYTVSQEKTSAPPAAAVKKKEQSVPQNTSQFQQKKMPTPRKRTPRRGFDKAEKKALEAELLIEKPLVLRPLTVSDFAEKSGQQVSDVIVALLKQGKACTKNHLLSVEQVSDLATHYEIETTKGDGEKSGLLAVKEMKKETGGQERLPVVVVMGHVDHGKTTLLDFIRKTRVASREKGGITQHLGAYEAQTDHGNIVFLDTPGHAAFSKIRERGASVADIAILVVAADDGVMPQTVESIKAIKSLGVPVIVAVNKVDKVDKARLEIVKRQLSQYDLLIEDWGGDVVCVPLSAKEGTGVDTLLEMISLQSQIMELKAVTTIPGQGYVLESKMERGRGPVATVLCRQGTVRVGDFFSAGPVWGKVTSLVDSSGKQRKEVGPSTPISVTGFDDLAPVGELFRVVEEQEYRRERGSKVDSSSLASRLAAAAGKETVPVIFRADTNSSLEAILEGARKISKGGDRALFVVHSSVGNVTENDVILAETTGAFVASFHTKVEQSALAYARKSKTKVLSFDVIYKLFEALELSVKKEAEKETKLTKIGEALVLKVFDIKGLGVIAGCQVKDGRFSGKGTVIVRRGRQEVGKGAIKSLQRDKKTVKEVHTGFECAFLVDGFDAWQVDDIVECYLDVPVS